MSFEPADLENRSLEDLSDAEKKVMLIRQYMHECKLSHCILIICGVFQVLDDWANKFEKVRKYPIVGALSSE